MKAHCPDCMMPQATAMRCAYARAEAEWLAARCGNTQRERPARKQAKRRVREVRARRRAALSLHHQETLRIRAVPMFRHPRAIAALLACVAISAMILFATPLPASAQHIDTTHPVPLVNAGSAKCFSPTPQDGHFDWAGLPIQQRTCDTRFTTQFYIFVPLGFVPINDQGWFPCWGCIPAGTDGFFIKNDFTGLCVDARDGAKSDGSVVQQWTCRDKNARSMVWYVEPADFPDALRVRNLISDFCLDV